MTEVSTSATLLVHLAAKAATSGSATTTATMATATTAQGTTGWDGIAYLRLGSYPLYSQEYLVYERYQYDSMRVMNCYEMEVIQRREGGREDRRVIKCEKIYEEGTTNQEIFHEVVKPVVRKCLQGKYGTIFVRK